MIRYSLSKIFATFVPSTNTGKNRRLQNVQFYRDEIVDSAKALLEAKGAEVKVNTYEFGRADIKVKLPEYAAPCTFSVGTEWSDLLLWTGREAMLRITPDSEMEFVTRGDPAQMKTGELTKLAFREIGFYLTAPKTFGYGNSFIPEDTVYDGKPYRTSMESEHALFAEQLGGAPSEPAVRYRNDIKKIVNYMIAETAKVGKLAKAKLEAPAP